MANRKTKSKLNVRNRRTNAHSLSNHIGAKELLDYLVTPLHLPPFDISSSAYKQFIIDTIEHLLIEAFETILPEKVMGVQFIFAKRFRSNRKRQIQTDFSFPFLLCCKSEEVAINLSDGLAYVTRLLMNQNSSFHHRVRNRGLTYSPAICIYSINDPPVNKSQQKSTTNVLWVKLPIDAIYSEIKFPSEDIDPLHRRNGPRFFYNANLNPSIEKGFFDEEKELRISLSPSTFSIRTLYESSLTIDSRKNKLGMLLKELANDIDYLKRVSYLLKFGDVIVCTPHAYNESNSNYVDNSMNPHEIITDAGMTIVVDRKKGLINEDDWLRIQVVAQKLALFAGAAVSTASEARESFLNTLNRGFLHEFGNAANDINSGLDILLRKGISLSDSHVKDIEGRLQFASMYIKSAMTVYKTNEVNVEEMLKTLVAPVKMYQDVDIHPEISLSSQIKVISLWQTALIEVIRNSYKYGAKLPPNGKKKITLEAQQQENYVLVTISNQTTSEIKKQYQLGNPPEGWELIQDIAKSLKGSIEAKVLGDQVSIVLQIPIVKDSGAFYV